VREALRASLPFAPDGSIPHSTRAWAVRAMVPGARQSAATERDRSGSVA
jgi:hypothetical protein